MKHTSGFTAAMLLAILSILFASGCGKKADESKPMSEIRAEAEKMDAPKLKAMAQQYKSALVTKKAEVDKLAAKIKDIPIAEALGEEAKKLKADVDKLQKSVSALQERFTVYYEKLKEKGGDLTGLELP